MSEQLFGELVAGLAESWAADRKRWGKRVIAENIPLESMLSLLHAEGRTAQRFMWFIGDLVEMDPALVEPCMPILFSLRNEMPFPGMPRSVAKWLWITGIPASVEVEAIPQLLDWLKDPDTSIACKSYTGKALQRLADEDRVDRDELEDALLQQTKAKNKAYANRMQKLLDQIRQSSD